MIVNVRGVSGSGKSTLVRAVMSYYPEKIPRVMMGIRNPLGYFLKGVEGAPPLYVPGHYETPCGGCDTMPSANSVALRIFTAKDAGMNVLFEGSKFYGGTQNILRLIRAEPETVVISLTTPLDVCVTNLTKRRTSQRKDAKVQPSKIAAQYDRENDELEALEKAGVNVRTLVYEDALDAIKRLFKF